MIDRKNELIILAGSLTVALFVMGLIIYNRYNNKKTSQPEYEIVSKQSQSTEVNDIENDLMNTDLENIDKELQDIDKEFEQAY